MNPTSPLPLIGIASLWALAGCSIDSTTSVDRPEAHVAMASMQDTRPAPKEAGLPVPGIELEPGRFALVVTDPQVDFLSTKGVTWAVVGASVGEERNGREHRSAVQHG